MADNRAEIKELMENIMGDLEHGECFYDEGLMRHVIKDSEKLTSLLKQHNQEEEE